MNLNTDDLMAHAFVNEGKGTNEWWVGQYGDGRIRVECPSPQKPNRKGKEKALDGDRSRETRSSSFLRFI